MRDHLLSLYFLDTHEVFDSQTLKPFVRQEAGFFQVLLLWFVQSAVRALILTDLLRHSSTTGKSHADVFLHLCEHMKRFRGFYFERISEQEAANQSFYFIKKKFFLFLSFLSHSSNPFFLPLPVHSFFLSFIPSFLPYFIPFLVPSFFLSFIPSFFLYLSYLRLTSFISSFLPFSFFPSFSFILLFFLSSLPYF